MRINQQVLDGILYRVKYSSPAGTLQLIAGDKGLRAVLWKTDMQDELCRARVNAIASNPSQPILKQTASQLDEYFEGMRRAFTVPLELVGTNFQKTVWKTLLKIKYGKTKSYSWQADTIKNPQAVRAVGSANGKNPISIIVPCHRVIRKNQDLGGYGGGLAVKQKLLDLEGVEVTPTTTAAVRDVHCR